MKLKYLDELQNGDILVEDCGGLVTELSDYGFVIEERAKPSLQEIYNSLDSKNAEHVSLILNNPKGPLVIYSAITAEYGTTITEWVLDKLENDLDNFLSYFGIAQNYQPNNQPSNYMGEQEASNYQNNRQIRQPASYDYENEPEYSDDSRNYQEQQRVQQYPEEVYRDSQQVEYLRNTSVNTGRNYQPEVPQRNYINNQEVSARNHNYGNRPQNNTPNNQADAEYFRQNEFDDFCNLALRSNANNINKLVNDIKYSYNNGDMVNASANLADLLDELERRGLI